MAESNFEAIQSQYRQVLLDCRQLYLSAAQQWIESRGAMYESPSALPELMEDLHKGLLIKVYSSITQADRHLSAEEARLAEILFEHLWGQRLSGAQLREAVQHIFEQGSRLKWYSLVRPFEHLGVLSDRVDELETIIVRMANLVAKCDGTVSESEAGLLRKIEEEVRVHLRPITLAEDGSEDTSQREGAKAVQEIEAHTPHLNPTSRSVIRKSEAAIDKRSAAQRLAEALAELNGLIGLEKIKREVATLANFLKLQEQRRKAGLPVTDLSLHMVFNGNPGTGKTSVARIIGRILGAMGILAKGHLIETDRSGLVAQYAGQTGPRTHKTIDEALDGVLFIDEAYSLVADEGEDAYGREAIQALLKRMEDDRERLVVILAGYPEPMSELLRSNPGLSSRFSTTLSFDDYRPSELGCIFQSLCDKNRYHVPGTTQAKLLAGFRWLYEHRDEHFGNGRTARNVFEQAIRRLADRIAAIVPVTDELLTVIEPADIDMPDVPREVMQAALDESQRFLVPCPGCGGKSKVPAAYLSRTVKCKSCGHQFTAAWGEPLDVT